MKLPFLGKRGAALVLFAVLALGADLREVAAQDEPKTSAMSLVITVHVTPANRLPFHREIAAAGLERFEAWKREGILKSYTILSSRYVDTGGWDTMILLDFASVEDVARWNKIEEANAAGLSGQELNMATAIDTASVDLVREDGLPTALDSPKPAVLVIPYESLVPADQYLKYLDGYTIPQLRGWIAEGVLAHYSIYISKFPAGRPWSAILVLDYAGDQGLAKREAAVATVRAKLKEDPAWKAWADEKRTMRSEKQAVVANKIEWSGNSRASKPLPSNSKVN